MNLSDLQIEVGDWASRNFPDAKQHQPLLGAAEELGELCHAHLKGEQRIRHSTGEIHDMKNDAVGDIIIYLAHYCELQGISLSGAVATTWHKVKQRDWQKNKMDADKHVS